MDKVKNYDYYEKETRSSHSVFSGSFIPYWYYEQNGVEHNQIPDKEDMEKQLGKYLENNLDECEFYEYRNQGFDIGEGEPNVTARIEDNEVSVDVNMKLSVEGKNVSYSKNEHEASVDSNLGSLYDSAKKVYQEENERYFPEKYVVDFVTLYAPVNGVKWQCSPEIWDAERVIQNVSSAIETNTLALGRGGSEASHEYFHVDLPVDEEVRFITSSEWESYYEVNPSKGNNLVAEPIGNNPSLGALGFCFAPYHFVYTAKYPVFNTG